MFPLAPMDEQEPATYTPLHASKLALERASRAACAAGTFSSLPIHVTMHVFCSALPYEKETCHGLDVLFIALRLSVAVSSLSSSSLVSPDRKKMPGMAAGTVRSNVVTMSAATVSGGSVGALRPFLTMLGLSTAPSRYTPCSL